MTLRKECDVWRFCKEGEPAQELLARFFIGIDELRARLNPTEYPNLEISDEGYLWFNMPSSLGKWEIFALPEGMGGLPGPALALSLPHDPKDLGKNFIEALYQVSLTIPGMRVFCDYPSAQQILEAYSENRLPHMHLLGGKDEILAMSNDVDFLSYCGLHFSVKSLDVLAAENLIKRVVSLVEARVRDLQKNINSPV